FTTHSSAAPRHLHSFPTRRSSDLAARDCSAFRASAGWHPTGAVESKRTQKQRRPKFESERQNACRPTDPFGLPPCAPARPIWPRSEEHTSELQSRFDLVCRLLLEK